ncbi:MAG: hypothetical protein HXM42_01110 [Lautropia mirabilis]|nr:hypothetical protein [Lautropia mirabilis]
MIWPFKRRAVANDRNTTRTTARRENLTAQHAPRWSAAPVPKIERPKQVAHHEKSLALASAILISGCAAVNNVTPAQKDENIQHVCVVKNPQVKIAETINIIREGFSRHGISTSVVDSDSSCKYSVTYTARRSWDFSFYLGRFEMQLWKEGRQIASAEYVQRSGSLSKWGKTKERMDAMIDQMLAAYPTNGQARQ